MAGRRTPPRVGLHDFYHALKGRISNLFCEHVDPQPLYDVLCSQGIYLNPNQEGQLKAHEKQKGRFKANDFLLDCLVMIPDWFTGLQKALTHERLGLEFLVEKFEDENVLLMETHDQSTSIQQWRGQQTSPKTVADGPANSRHGATNRSVTTPRNVATQDSAPPRNDDSDYDGYLMPRTDPAQPETEDIYNNDEIYDPDDDIYESVPESDGYESVAGESPPQTDSVLKKRNSSIMRNPTPGYTKLNFQDAEYYSSLGNVEDHDHNVEDHDYNVEDHNNNVEDHDNNVEDHDNNVEDHDNNVEDYDDAMTMTKRVSATEPEEDVESQTEGEDVSSSEPDYIPLLGGALGSDPTSSTPELNFKDNFILKTRSSVQSDPSVRTSRYVYSGKADAVEDKGDQGMLDSTASSPPTWQPWVEAHNQSHPQPTRMTPELAEPEGDFDPETDFEQELVDRELTSMPGYHVGISEDGVEENVTKRKDGTYLIWYFEGLRKPAITVMHCEELKTFLIKKRRSHSGMKYFMYKDQKEAYSLKELVDHHLGNGIRYQHRHIVLLQTPVTRTCS